MKSVEDLTREETLVITLTGALWSAFAAAYALSDNNDAIEVSQFSLWASAYDKCPHLTDRHDFDTAFLQKATDSLLAEGALRRIPGTDRLGVPNPPKVVPDVVHISSNQL